MIYNDMATNMAAGVDTIKNFLRSIPCNICGSDDFTVVFPAVYAPDDNAEQILCRFREKGGDMLFDQVVRCGDCGLVYIRPRLCDEIVVREYSKASIHGYKEQFVSQNAGREISFRRSMRHIKRLCPVPGMLLDVGAASGTFMAIARQEGWQVRGCEPNEWFCAWARDHYGLIIDQGVLGDQSYEDASFDLITLWDVVEHVSDPARLLEKCFDLLKPGGHLVCTYPDIGSWIARCMGRRWVFLMSVHLYYFSRSTIARLLRKCGFMVLKCAPHFQTLEFEYIAYRMRTYSRLLSAAGRIFLSLFGMRKMMVPYWVGINCVVARKPGVID